MTLQRVLFLFYFLWADSAFSEFHAKIISSWRNNLVPELVTKLLYVCDLKSQRTFCLENTAMIVNLHWNIKFWHELHNAILLLVFTKSGVILLIFFMTIFPSSSHKNKLFPSCLNAWYTQMLGFLQLPWQEKVILLCIYVDNHVDLNDSPVVIHKTWK